MRVEIIVHEGKRRAVALLELETAPEGGYVMAPELYDSLKPKLVAKYGDFEEKEVPATAELLAMVEEIRKKEAQLRHGHNGEGE